jgi:hypothetical protein
MITRLGKIGRLPKRVRDVMGLKIGDGVPGTELAAWLNGLPEAQACCRSSLRAGRSRNKTSRIGNSTVMRTECGSCSAGSWMRHGDQSEKILLHNSGRIIHSFCL